MLVNLLTRDPVTPVSQGISKGRPGAAAPTELGPDPRAEPVHACGPASGPLEKAAARARGEEPQPRFLEDRIEPESWR